MYTFLLFVVICQLAAADFNLSCLKTKTKPKEEKLILACQRFSSLSCCKPGATKDIASISQKIRKFSWHPCGKRLSRQCNKYMRRMQCFYECSPFISQWKHPMRYAGVERVPVCSSFCDSFYQACRDDLTCVKNWLSDFVIEKGGKNKCPKESKCKKFSDIYRNGEDMCSTMWGDSLQYTKSKKKNDCFDVDFEGPNPNWNVHKKDGKASTQKRNNYFLKFFHLLAVEEKIIIE